MNHTSHAGGVLRLLRIGALLLFGLALFVVNLLMPRSGGAADDDQFVKLKCVQIVSVEAPPDPQVEALMKLDKLRGETMANKVRGKAAAVISKKIRIQPDRKIHQVKVYAKLEEGKCPNGCHLKLIAVRTVVEETVHDEGKEYHVPIWQVSRTQCVGHCDLMQLVLNEVGDQADKLVKDWQKTAKPPPPKIKYPPGTVPMN